MSGTVQLSTKLAVDNVNASNGPLVHFVNMQTMDLFVSGSVLTDDGLINKRVHRIFRQVTRPISLFSFEQTFQNVTTLTYGNGGEQTELSIAGDIIYDFGYIFIFPTINISQVADVPSDLTGLTTEAINARKTLKQFAYCTNLGPSIVENSIFYVDSLPVDQNKTQTQILLHNLLKRRDQRDLYNNLVGNNADNCQLNGNHEQFKLFVPMKFFFSGSPQKSFQIIRAGGPKIKVHTKLRALEDVICCTRNLKDYSFSSKLAYQKNIGFLFNEVYLNDQERKIISNSGAQQWLIEQNLYWTTKPGTQQETSLIPTTFMHPCKYMMYGAQKQKYITKQAFLAYQPVIEGTDTREQLLRDASIRYVLKFAKYVAILKLNGKIQASTGTANLDNTTGVVTVQSFAYKPYQQDYRTLLIEFANTNGYIQQCFDGVNLIDKQQAGQQVKDKFNRMLPYVREINNKQRFDQYGIIFQGGYLTLDEASSCVDGSTAGNLKGQHLPSVVPFTLGTKIDNAYAALLGITGDIPLTAQFNFSLYSQGAVQVRAGLNNALVTLIADAKGSDLFGNVINEPNFNWGLDEFDILVNQWDNFGKYLDKSGSLINWIEYFVANVSRFKQSTFYTEQLHAMNYFPGKPAQQSNVYSFCLDPLVIQPTGSLNLSKGQQKITINSDLESNDDIFFSLVVYNVMDFRENTVQVMYQSNLN